MKKILSVVIPGYRKSVLSRSGASKFPINSDYPLTESKKLTSRLDKQQLIPISSLANGSNALKLIKNKESRGLSLRPFEQGVIMKVRKGLITIAVGAILAATGAAYSAPVRNYYSNDERHERVGEAREQRGYAMIRRGEELERRGYGKQGEELERRGRELVREGERIERRGERSEHHDWRN
jgi:hypothetical protein